MPQSMLAVRILQPNQVTGLLISHSTGSEHNKTLIHSMCGSGFTRLGVVEYQLQSG